MFLKNLKVSTVFMAIGTLNTKKHINTSSGSYKCPGFIYWNSIYLIRQVSETKKKQTFILLSLEIHEEKVSLD